MTVAGSSACEFTDRPLTVPEKQDAELDVMSDSVWPSLRASS